MLIGGKLPMPLPGEESCIGVAGLHAADVLQAAGVLLDELHPHSLPEGATPETREVEPGAEASGGDDGRRRARLDDLQAFALVLGAAIHDVYHPGVTNAFRAARSLSLSSIFRSTSLLSRATSAVHSSSLGLRRGCAVVDDIDPADPGASGDDASSSLCLARSRPRARTSHPCAGGAGTRCTAQRRASSSCTMALITALGALDPSTQLLIYGLLTVHVGALVFWAYMCSRPQVRHADKLE